MINPLHPLVDLVNRGDAEGVRALQASSGPFPIDVLNLAAEYAVGWDQSEILADLAAWMHEAEKDGHMERLGKLLSSAIRRDNDKSVALLIGLGTPIDWRILGASSFHQAAESGNIKALRFIAHRLPIDTANSEGETALHVACRNLRSEALEILIAAGADPERRDFRGCNALDHARRGVADTTFDPNWWEQHPGHDQTGSVGEAYERICAALAATKQSVESDPTTP